MCKLEQCTGKTSNSNHYNGLIFTLLKDKPVLCSISNLDNGLLQVLFNVTEFVPSDNVNTPLS